MTNYPDLDVVIPLIFFSAPVLKDQEDHPLSACSHLGTLVKDGYHQRNGGKIQRFRCSTCQKRFGIDVSMYELYTYQTQMQQLIYDIFFARISQKELESRWGIPQSKISRFKKSLITQILQDPSFNARYNKNLLPNGILRADETFMGKRGNSNTEINMVNANFETIAAGSAVPGKLIESVRRVYSQIPESEQKKLKVLITDGEPAYEFIPLEGGGRIIHVQQLHAKEHLGEVIINKFEKFGPHHLHYIIKTHWKVFKQGNIAQTFEWEIKFIKSIFKTGRGRPRKDQYQSKAFRLWRQKRDEYASKAFQKKGTATVFVNCETETISPRARAKQWMITLLTPVLKIFNGKCITNNGAESKHSQVKRKGASRKQKDLEYSDHVFRITAYIAENKHLPRVKLEGRPLYRYLMKPRKLNREHYTIQKSNAISHQMHLTAYMK